MRVADAVTIAGWNANREAAAPLLARMLRRETLEVVELHALLAMLEQVVALSPRVAELCPELPIDGERAAAQAAIDGIRAGMAIFERTKAAPMAKA